MRMIAKDLTLEGKIALVKGVSFFHMAGIPDKGINGVFCLDGGTGINFEQLFGDFCCISEEMHHYFGSKTLQNVIANYYEPENLNEEELHLREWITKQLEKKCKQEVFSPGCFPAGILMGSTWNPDRVYDVAVALGKEAAAYDVDLLLGTPYVNIARDPLSGRLFEGYGEDPYLMSVLAPEAVRGVQEQGVAANVKHFAANNQETFRVGLDEIISKRALHEIYLPAFKACVDAGVATVMSAYNKINGTPCTENHWLLTELLREAWGFDGTVISDWGAVAHLDKAVAAGNDIAMPGPIDGSALLEAVKEGTLSEETLDKAVDYALRLIEKCKDLKAQAEKGKTQVSEEESDRAAYDAAVEGIVLLKNENNVFPIEGDVALFGDGAKGFFDCGTGSAGITTDRTGSLYEELRRIKGEAHVTFEEITPQTKLLLVVGRKQGMEGNDHLDMCLPKEEEDQIAEVIALGKKLDKKVGVILNVCGPIDCSSFEEEADGIFCVYLPGMQGAKAMAALLTGEENPSGRLTVTFPKRYEDTPTYLNFPGDGYHTIYGEDIFVGYRYYDTKKMDVLFPFGHGLSYTSFTYGKITVDKKIFSDEVTISVSVKNSGSRFGKEVVMLFVHDVKSTLRKPEKELKGFKKVGLNPGESKTVNFTITKDMLSAFDMDLGRWEAEEGYYDFIIARSGADIVDRVRVYGEWKSSYSFSMDTPIGTLYRIHEARTILFDIFHKYGLDVGCLEDTYEYNSHTLIGKVIKNAVLRVEGLEANTEKQVCADIMALLNTVRKE